MSKVDPRRSSDIAGPDYWNHVWEQANLPPPLDVDSNSLRRVAQKSLFQAVAGALARVQKSAGRPRLVEVGCASSRMLPVVSKKLGFDVVGLDYSEVGCDQARAMLAREGVVGEIVFGSVFAPPEALIESCDAVMSFGLVEHFADTAEIVTAMARLLKPGGVMFTNVPNLNGTIGWVQKHLMSREVFDIHVLLTPADLRLAHEKAGLAVVHSDYFLSTNFSVLNAGDGRPGGIVWWMKRSVRSALIGASGVVWAAERLIGRLPPSRAFAPYVNCVAVKCGVGR
jgi:2-polyprenyl-3-methyl-5-hydroxy-6-metoxy-1,4-benzoquinol methylase